MPSSLPAIPTNAPDRGASILHPSDQSISPLDSTGVGNLSPHPKDQMSHLAESGSSSWPTESDNRACFLSLHLAQPAVQQQEWDTGLCVLGSP